MQFVINNKRDCIVPMIQKYYIIISFEKFEKHGQ